jgi:GNAT superfamily N-acetyltransferase
MTIMSGNQPQLSFQPPVGDQLRFFHRSLPASQQSSAIPKTFCDALTVREAVFVKEMGAVPLAHHTDTDDARSYHWVLYSPTPPEESPKHSSQPIGTIRIVPYPHHPHPEPGARYEAPGPDAPVLDGETVFLAPHPPYIVNRKTNLHDGKEPYLKIGRLCVIKEFRGKKLADVLMQTALKWAADNPAFSKDGEQQWKGLVCAHVQEKAVTVWQRNGFVVDERMGVWAEAGITHFGMFCLVDLPPKSLGK